MLQPDISEDGTTCVMFVKVLVVRYDNMKELRATREDCSCGNKPAVT